MLRKLEIRMEWRGVGGRWGAPGNGVESDGDGGVVSERCSCQVNILQCTLEGV